MPIKGVYTPHETAQVNKAIDYINKHYTDDISIESLVEEARLDRKIFLRLFLKITGYTVHNYLVKVRLERAKEDLGDFSLTVAQVAHRNGFNSGSYFGKKFRKVIGLMPTEFRLQLISEEFCAVP
jgi:two-component system response regulator YesN